MRRMAGAALAVLCLGTIVAACAPVKEPVKQPPPEQPPPPPPPDTPHPPDSALPPGTPNFSFTNVVTGLSNPWDMSFLNDGTMFYTQRAGGITVRRPDGSTAATWVPANSSPAGAAGVMGIDVTEPAPVTNLSQVFVCYAAPGDIRVVRYDYNVLLATVVPTPTTVITGIPRGGDLYGCRVRIHPSDGKLYVTTGDAMSPTGPQDNSLAGKVLRVPLGGGTTEIFTRGHRNPQGLDFLGGVPWISEHGPGNNDEVEKLFAGGNGGWDPNAGGTYFFDADMSGPAQTIEPQWRSGDSFTLAPSGMTFVNGPEWGALDGALIVTFLKDSQARAMRLSGGNIVSSHPFMSGFGRLRSAVQHPDGSLFVSTDNGAGDVIVKVTPS
jgi:glucose/arabinose dehydrogenase